MIKLNKIQFSKINNSNLSFEDFIDFQNDKYCVLAHLENLISVEHLQYKVINMIINKMNVSNIEDLIFIQDDTFRKTDSTDLHELFSFYENKHLLCFRKSSFKEDFDYICRILKQKAFI